jgi:hypothetical protein
LPAAYAFFSSAIFFAAMSMSATLVLISPEIKYFSRSGFSRSRSDMPFFDIRSRIISAGMKPLSA